MIRSNLARFFSKDLSVKSISKRVGQLSYEALMPSVTARLLAIPLTLHYSQMKPKEEMELSDSPTESMFPSKGLLDVIPEDLGPRSQALQRDDFFEIRRGSFIHALDFNKQDIEFANFKLSDIETTVS